MGVEKERKKLLVSLICKGCMNVKNNRNNISQHTELQKDQKANYTSGSSLERNQQGRQAPIESDELISVNAKSMHYFLIALFTLILKNRVRLCVQGMNQFKR